MNNLLAVKNLLAVLLLAACAPLPTVQPVENNLLATPVPTLQPVEIDTPTPLPTVTVTGNVWLRDDGDARRGWLEKGTSIEAVCTGSWCVVLTGQYQGLRFWRGCSSDNPAGLGCRER